MTTRSLRPVEWTVVAIVSLGLLFALGLAPLSTPYWWDAGAVYVPGARWIASHHFAAVPGVFPSVLGRGHTTLYYVLLAAAFRVAGTSAPVVGHALTVAFAVATVALTYALGTWLYGRRAGAIAAVLLVVAPLFLTMSFEALPEVPIAALTVATLYAFARGRNGWAGAMAVLLVLCKETGLACPLAIVGAVLLDALRGGDRRRAMRAGLAMLPSLVALGAFFVWQRVAEGWWVLPYHAQLFDAVQDIPGQIARVTRSVFVDDGRFVVGLAAVTFALADLRRTRSADRAPPARDEAPAHRVVVFAIALDVLANLVFFAKMFFLERYVLAIQPGLCVLLAGALLPEHVSRLRSAAAAFVLLATCGIAVARRDAGHDFASGETTFRYLHAVRAYRSVYRDLEARPAPAAVLTAWPLTDQLADPSLGWVRRSYPVDSIERYESHDRHMRDGRAVDVVLAAPGLGGYDALRSEAMRLGMHLAQPVRDGRATLEVWQR